MFICTNRGSVGRGLARGEGRTPCPSAREVIEGGEGGGVWDQKNCVAKMAQKFFPFVNFVFSHDGHFGLGGGAGLGGYPPSSYGLRPF